MQPQKRSLKMPAAALLSIAALALVAWISPGNYYQMMMENDIIRSLKKKIAAYNDHMPEDRLYLQFDKPMYEPGDNIWFSAFIRDAVTLKPSSKSDIVHVEFINPKGTVEKSINIIAKNGIASGDFILDNEALGGLYKVKAYTNWMKNDGGDNNFEKMIQVQDIILPNLKMKLDFERKAFGPGDEVIAKLELNTNENKPLSFHKFKIAANLDGKQFTSINEITDENGLQYIKFTLPSNLKTNDGLLNVMIDYNGSTESISRSIPILLNTLKLELFPEGGDLVDALESNVAFKAVNEFDKPADVEGILIDSKGNSVTSIASFHQGMGAFKFIPKAGEKYSVKITKPENIKATYDLPVTHSRGYVMNVNVSPSEVALNIGATMAEELSIVAQTRNKVYYSTVVDAKKGTNKVVFPTSGLPIGVCQITLFDSKGIARAERLAFVNKNKQLNVSIETDKEKYLPRDKVKMKITVKDERGMPMPASLSMAVVNDQFLSFADDKSGNILSQLLLQQDIKQKIEEPSFYFNIKEPKADKALDYLLMTAGWRRFTWEKLMNDELPPVIYKGEKAIVAGTVMNINTGKIINNATIRINNKTEFQTDENGRFIFNKLDLSSPVTLSCSASGFSHQSLFVRNYDQNLVVYLYDQNYYKNFSSVPGMAGSAAFPDNVLSEKGIEENLEMEPSVNFSAKKKDEVKRSKSQEKNKFLELAKENSKQEKPAVSGNAEKMKEDHHDKKVRVMAKSADARDEAFDMMNVNENNNIAQQAVTVYYRAREFSSPVYNKDQNVEVRNDFRNTIYWNPYIEVDKSGKSTIEFYTPDDITSFRTTVEGVASDGTIGRGESVFFTQLPFSMSTKIPVEVATEDNVSIPLTLKNNTDKPIGGVLTINSPSGLKALAQVASAQTIMPGAARTIYLDYKVLDKIGYGDFTVSFKACGLGDSFTKQIKISAKGFPSNVSFSGQEIEKEYSFTMNNVVKGSVRASFTAFPNVVNDLMKGVEGILREPYGCFEQTSCTAYPNAMVLDYLRSTDSKDNQTLARATDLLNRGYKRLTTFESKEKGYEWFGADPAHEGLTAYGIMEFTDMKKAGAEVDQNMLNRTANWLMKHKDGKGGFSREKRAYHDFGRISDVVLNAYIVYALAEAGYKDIKNEFNTAYKNAISSKDPYLLAMMANASYNLNENLKGEAAMKLLLDQQKQDGSFTGTTHSITYSQGASLTIETTSIAIMAMMKSNSKDPSALSKAVRNLVGSRSGSGVFSSTQGTILALKALTEYAKFSKKINESGTIEIYVDGRKAGERTYVAGEKGAVEINGLEEFIKNEGTHNIKIKYAGVKEPLPYSVSVNWNTSLPESDKECYIDLQTKLASKTANVGQTVRLTATITNKRQEEVPSTMAIIGIPAGFTVQPWQLKELQDKNVFDYYEMKGNNIAIYYRGMDAGSVKVINLDLKAEMPGIYEAPASSAYLYYTNEYKTWTNMDRVTIKKNG